MRPLERPKLAGVPCHTSWQGTAQRRASFSPSRRPGSARRLAALLSTRRPSDARCLRQRILRLRTSRPCPMAGDCPVASALPWPGPSSTQAAPGGEPRGPSAPGPPRMLAEGEGATQARVQGAQAPAGVRGWPRAAKGGPLGGLRGAARPSHRLSGSGAQRPDASMLAKRIASLAPPRTANPTGLQKCALLPSGRRARAPPRTARRLPAPGRRQVYAS